MATLTRLRLERDLGQGTFDLALHAWDEPAETLLALAEPARARVLTPMLGRPFEPAHVEGPTPWWRAVGAPLPVPVSLGLP